MLENGRMKRPSACHRLVHSSMLLIAIGMGTFFLTQTSACPDADEVSPPAAAETRRTERTAEASLILGPPYGWIPEAGTAVY